MRTPRPHGEQQRIEGQLFATLSTYPASVHIDVRQSASDTPRPCVRRYPLQRIAASVRLSERLAHRQWPVGELVLRANERHVNAVASQATQAQQTLDPGDPATANHHLEIGDSSALLIADTEKGMTVPAP